LHRPVGAPKWRHDFEWERTASGRPSVAGMGGVLALTTLLPLMRLPIDTIVLIEGERCQPAQSPLSYGRVQVARS
jgi:hypothetical protein